MSSSVVTLPRPGLAYAVFPQRAEDAGSGWPAVLAALASALVALPGLRRRVRRARLGAALERELQQAQARLARARCDAAARAKALAAVRRALRQEGLSDRALGRALALAGDAAARRCAMSPYTTQLLAAATMLRGEFAEMATGEGKTLAMGLAAAVAALAGAPVHLLTANDYLAARDQALLEPLFDELGLTSGCVVAATPAAGRAALYRRDIVYSTAREVGFDYLRDHVAQAGERDPRRLRALVLAAGEREAAAPPAQPAAAEPGSPLLPGLCFALLDEADGLLLDEATVPLLLARAGGAVDTTLLYDAWRVAQSLTAVADYHLRREARRAELTAAGRAKVSAERPGRAAHRLADAVQSALAARHLFERDRDYVVTERAGRRAVVLVDEPTGRAAEGRRWQGDLTTFVQIKEGLPPESGPVTAAQITYPRLFGRYLHLAGMSGTLVDAAVQLRALYGARVRRVPLARPDRRQWLGTRMFTDAERHGAAVVAAVQREAARGRPVLVGTDSVAASAALSRRLTAAGMPHQRLDAQQDADEAARIARAGAAGCVTVATNIAGRGTDIRLDDAAQAAGGLHVIVTQLHRSRRIQRQLVGRAARHGDPGSAEALLRLDDRLLAAAWPRAVRAAAAALAWRGVVPRLLALPLAALAQRVQEAADALRRWQLARGERQLDDTLGFAGATE